MKGAHMAFDNATLHLSARLGATSLLLASSIAHAVAEPSKRVAEGTGGPTTELAVGVDAPNGATSNGDGDAGDGAATVIASANAEAIAEIARGFGEAEISETGEGDPVIVGTLNGVAYQVFFLNCGEAGDNCGILNFYAVWDVKSVGIDLVNRWNRERPFHKAYLTEDLFPVVELNLPVDGGVTEAQLNQAYEAFTVGVATFAAEIIGERAL